MEKKELKNPLSYMGSKRLELNKIIENEPKSFNKFVDVFAGGGVVALHYHQNNIESHYNEIDKSMCDLFNIIQCETKTKKLLEDLYNMPMFDIDNAETILKNTYEEFKKDNDIIKKLYLHRYSMRGLIHIGKPNLRLIDGKYVVECRSDHKHLLKYPEIFKEKKMKITNLDYKECIDLYKNDENAFLYLDPPYISTYTGAYYENKFTYKDIEYIHKIMNDKNIKCKIMLHMEFLGYTYDMFKNQMKVYYPKNYAIAAKKNAYQKYIMIATNY